MKKKWINYIVTVVFFTTLHFSCSDTGDTPRMYDPAKPITISSFLPDSGRINEKILLNGDNFGTDASKIHVFFNDKEAQVLSSSGDVIYALIPRSPGIDCTIKVKIDDQESVFEKQTYKYIISESVTTLLGKLKDDGTTEQKDGTFAETMFKSPLFLLTDRDNNLFTFESEEHSCSYARIRMANEKQDKVVTIASGDLTDAVFQPVMTPDQQTIYVPVTQKSRILIMEKSNGWAPKIFVDFTKSQYRDVQNVINNTKRVHSLALDNEGFLYLRTNSGDVVKVNTADKTAQALPNKAGNAGQNCFMVFNPHDDWIYCTLHVQCKIIRFSKDGQQVEDFAGSGAQGFADGVKESAKFSSPRGITIDKEGNLYVSDVFNHRIRKIITTDGTVTTYAGNGRAGWKDGIPTEASFNNPWGVCVDNDGFILVADKGNQRIRKIAIE